MEEVPPKTIRFLVTIATELNLKVLFEQKYKFITKVLIYKMGKLECKCQ